MQISTMTSTNTDRTHLRINIAAALSYQNDDLVARFASRQKVSLEEATHLFGECKKFLITCVLFRGPCSPSPQLDEMWHHFILHTRAYAEYCNGCLGYFVNHDPTEIPNIGNRVEMLDFAEQLFEDIDHDLWPQVGITDCDSACSGDSYCSGDIR